MLVTTISENLLGYITHSIDRFCSSNHAKVRRAGISEIWNRGICLVDIRVNWHIGQIFDISDANRIRNL